MSQSKFRENGFVVFNGLLKDEIEEITRWIDELTNFPEVPGKYMFYYEKLNNSEKKVLQRIENFVEYHEQLGQLAYHEKIKERLTDYFEEEPMLFKDKINFKLPGASGFEPHQDIQAGWDDYTDFFINVSITVDEHTIENGCLEFAQGAHKRELIGKSWEPLSDELLSDIKFEKVLTKPGDVVIFDCFVPHQSAKNNTDSPRRNVFYTYNKRSNGDFRKKYFEDKRASFPPDIERNPDEEYKFKV